MYRWHAFSYEWFGTKTRFARGKSQLFVHELLREPLIHSQDDRVPFLLSKNYKLYLHYFFLHSHYILTLLAGGASFIISLVEDHRFHDIIIIIIVTLSYQFLVNRCLNLF